MTIHQGGKEAFESADNSGPPQRMKISKYIRRIDHSWSGRSLSAARVARDYTRGMTVSQLEFYQRDVFNGTLSLSYFEFSLRPVSSHEEHVNTLREEPKSSGDE